MSDDEHPDPTEPAGVRLAREIRRRRTAASLSQPQLAQKIRYTRQYVSLAERADHNLPSMEIVKAIDHALQAEGALIALREQGKNEQNQRRRHSTTDSMVNDRSPVDDVAEKQRPLPRGISAARFGLGVSRYTEALVDRLHRTYQAARYDEVIDALPGTLQTIDSILDDSSGSQRRQGLSLRCQAAIVAAKVATKMGDGIAAYEAAEQARAAAEAADNVFGQASAAYQLTCALLRLDAADEAEHHALQVADSIRGQDPHSCTWRGALLLISAVIAARRGDTDEAHQRLGHAGRLAATLGRDGNIGFTAFGPTNVRIHRVSAAVATGDPHRVLTEAEHIDVTSLPPGLHGRQGQFHLDNAWAQAQLGEDPLAVIHLLETERIAPQLLRTHRAGRTLVRELMAREQHRRTPGLRSLAQRIGVLA
ncbi:transcriptional regulator with XRE-family HTH domain [Saccharothrix longispora]|uniref:Transcriptional regulator with XRE-family HTH domain n=2 Tax=Saccharothrix longispora TaxID=33920 RepID=A0ABU1PNX6_9PSEU|nr:helix-turn-helix transcriptional regulator [Saccharothrix longispora]MDR6592286.1 transcriptional regulator with XRE-family HTH domain [Saccharothrix longispora]